MSSAPTLERNRPRRDLAGAGARPGGRSGSAHRDGRRGLSRGELSRRPDAPAAGRCADRPVARGRSGDGGRFAQRCAVDLPHRPCRIDPGVAAARRATRRALQSASRACCATSLRSARGSQRYIGAGAEADVADLRCRRDRLRQGDQLRQRDRGRAGAAGRARAVHVRDTAQLHRKHPRRREFASRNCACSAESRAQRMAERVGAIRRRATTPSSPPPPGRAR